MKSKRTNFSIYRPVIIVNVFLIFLFMISCTNSNLFEETIQVTEEKLPDYLMLITPTGIVYQSDYDDSISSSTMWMNRGIAISIWAKKMGVAEENLNWEIIKERSSLIVNDKLLSKDTFVGGADGEKNGGLFRLSWAPKLGPGSYYTTFIFLTDAGESLEYNWEFTIVE